MNHKTKIHKFSLMMALLVLAGSASALLSCGGEEPSAGSTQTTDAPIVTEAVTEDPGPKLDLPEADYGGMNFNMLIPTEYTDHYVAESETGDVVLDAVYKRNRAVEELLNIKYNYIPESGGWESRDAFKGIIRNSVLAGDGAYDLIAGYQVVTLPLTLEGVFMDINEVPNIDLEKPWWVHNLIDTIGIGGKLFTVIGDASISLYSEIPVLYFNKKLLADYNLPDPYPMVTEGTWTLDALFDMVKDAHSDINGDGKLVFGEDNFGYTAVAVAQRAFQTSAEFTVFDYDDNGMPCFVELSERDADLYFRMSEFIKSPGVHAYGVTNHVEFITPFISDQVLITNGFIQYTNYLRDMKSDFATRKLFLHTLKLRSRKSIPVMRQSNKYWTLCVKARRLTLRLHSQRYLIRLPTVSCRPPHPMVSQTILHPNTKRMSRDGREPLVPCWNPTTKRSLDPLFPAQSIAISYVLPVSEQEEISAERCVDRHDSGGYELLQLQGSHSRIL